MKREEVRARIEEIGIIPAVRVLSAEEALFAAEAVSSGGIPIVEITMTIPGAIQVVSDLVRRHPEMVVGAGSILDIETARQCVDAGANFLTSTGLNLKIVEFAVKEKICVFPGALTPTEITEAWLASSDFVKVFPCAEMGGESYIRALKAPLPQVPLIASGGVSQQNAGAYILAGAVALGIGDKLIPKGAIRERQAGWIHELVRRFVGIVKNARAQMAGTKETDLQRP